MAKILPAATSFYCPISNYFIFFISNKIFSIIHPNYSKSSPANINCFLCFLPNIYWQVFVSFNPFRAKLPLSESGYLEGWTAGWGVKSVADYLISRSRNFNVIIGTEGYFGTLPDGLQIYTDSLPA